MKKMITAVFAVMFVVSTYAGSVSWASVLDDGSDYSPFTDNTASAFSGTAYLFLLTGSSDLVTYSAGAWDLNSATLLATSTGGSLDGVSGAFGNWAETIADANITSSSYYQVVLVTATGQTTLADVSSGYWQESSGQLLTGYADIGGIDRSGGLAFQQDDGFTAWAAVPEPTSMALLSFGVVALGLRRKFRK